MAHDVFISYSSKDKLIADAVCNSLEGQNVRCWYAPRDIQAGMNWTAAIMEAIATSKIVVLVWSANANLSQDVIREVQHAFRKSVTVIPFRTESVTPSKDLEYYLESVHWLDALTPPIENHLLRLNSTVKLLLSNNVSPESPHVGADPALAPRGYRGLSRRKLIIGFIALLICAVLGVLFFIRDKQSQAQSSSKDSTSIIVNNNNRNDIDETISAESLQAQLRPLYAGFASGRAELMPHAKEQLDGYADLMKKVSFKIIIEGHRNEYYPAANIPLTQMRANAVKEYLVLRGVDPARLTAVGYGAERPLKEGYSAYNDRVEFKVLAQNQNKDMK